jgi:hypothetical protein
MSGDAAENAPGDFDRFDNNTFEGIRLSLRAQTAALQAFIRTVPLSQKIKTAASRA